MYQKSWNSPCDSSTRTGGPAGGNITVTRSKGTMRVHVHTKFCFLCVLTFLFQQFDHCHGEGHSDHHHANHTHSDLQISEAPYVKRTAESESEQGDALEEEQHFYIQQLFRRYGQKDQLDFKGFQSLLFSLGLGEVKVVDTNHEDLGHDHVAHLELLDVKEGVHSHSRTSDSKGFGHGDEHGHGHSHDNPGHHHPHTEQESTQCNHRTAAAIPAAGAATQHDHKHHHGHDHNHSHGQDAETADDRGKVEDSGKTHTDGHGQDPQDISQEQLSPSRRDPSQPLKELKSTPAPTERRTKKPRKPGRGRGQRQQTTTPSPVTPVPHDHDHGHDHDHDLDQGHDHDHAHDHDHDHTHDHSHDHDHDHGHTHGHKHKREAPGVAANPTLQVSVISGHAGGLPHQHEECLNLTQLLNYYGLTPDSLISPSQFTYLCPALLYQIDSRFCIRHYHQVVQQEALAPGNTVWTWVWGFVSITIISLLSLLGVVLVPILNQACFKFLLTFLVALAVGTLSGDALLHLMPHSQGHHDHSEVGKSHETDMATEFDGVWKGLTALAGIYLLFIIEHCIGMFKHYKDRKGLRKGSEEGKIGRKLSDHKLNRRSDAEWMHLKPLNEDPDSMVVSCDNDHNATQLSELRAPDSHANKTSFTDPEQDQKSPTKVNGHKAKQHGHGHGHSHGGNCHSDQEMKDAGIASIAWMVIMGDGMHNFSDGLAIGAAFSSNLTGGISTSVAVFCHELPHELGDFAVLLKAGMSVKQAIVYNLLSALMAYVGMLIGTAVGQYTHNVTNWIFAITAGMFLYVALVDMLPEMLHGDSEDHKRCQLGHFVLQNLGLLTGFGIMLLIAIFEDRIVFDFGF